MTARSGYGFRIHYTVDISIQLFDYPNKDPDQKQCPVGTVSSSDADPTLLFSYPDPAWWVITDPDPTWRVISAPEPDPNYR